MRHDCGGIYDERGVVKGEVLVVDWSIVAAFVKLLRAALPNPIQFSIVRAKIRFLSCGARCVAGAIFSVGVWEQRALRGSVRVTHQRAWNNIQEPSVLWESTATINQISAHKLHRNIIIVSQSSNKSVIQILI